MIYRSRNSKDVHRTKCKVLTITRLTHSQYITKIARIRCYIMLGTIFKCKDVQDTAGIRPIKFGCGPSNETATGKNIFLWSRAQGIGLLRRCLVIRCNTGGSKACWRQPNQGLTLMDLLESLSLSNQLVYDLYHRALQHDVLDHPYSVSHLRCLLIHMTQKITHWSELWHGVIYDGIWPLDKVVKQKS